jgi:hypothetical protein
MPDWLGSPLVQEKKKKYLEKPVKRDEIIIINYMKL